MALTKYNYNSFDLTTAASKGLGFNSDADGFETSSAGSMTLIKTITASSSSTVSFVNGSSDVVLDNTYSVYKFQFINIHPSAHIEFAFNASVDTGSNYNVAKTTTTVASWHAENGASSGLSYIDEDLAQGTGVARISGNLYTDNDSSMSGVMYLFNPSSTTFVKHFLTDTQRMDYSSQGYTNRWLSSGYMNSTSAVDAIQFSMVSGNIDAGTIKLYGIKDS
tara:strand:+ start:68 stop:730 length:663 start_codon:yes stop_codon:yes gene_type:complete